MRARNGGPVLAILLGLGQAGCDSGDKSDSPPPAADGDASKKTAAPAKVAAPPAAGNLPKLFEGSDDCNVIDAATIAETLELTAEAVTVENAATCSYGITFDDASSPMVFSRAVVPKGHIAEQIAGCDNGAPLLISHPDVSDGVHICEHKMQGHITLRHPGHPNAVRITYGGLLAKGLSKPQKAGRAKAALKLADAIIARHRG